MHFLRVCVFLCAHPHVKYTCSPCRMNGLVVVFHAVGPGDAT